MCTARVGNADKSFSENSEKPEKSAAPIYGGWFRVLSGGSKWNRALPGAAGGSRQRRLRLSKNPRRAREGRSPFELSIVPSGVYGGHGAIFAPENPIFQRKNRFLAVFAPEKSLIFSGDW